MEPRFGFHCEMFIYVFIRHKMLICSQTEKALELIPRLWKHVASSEPIRQFRTVFDSWLVSSTIEEPGQPDVSVSSQENLWCKENGHRYHSLSTSPAIHESRYPRAPLSTSNVITYHWSLNNRILNAAVIF